MAESTSRAVLPTNGRWPVAHSYRTTPSENKSERPSSASPADCSGDMYDAVPRVIPGDVSASTTCDVRLHGILAAQQLGEAEVHHLHVAALGEEDIRGLDVAMHDALRVRGVERVGDLDADVDNLLDLERAGRDAIVQCLALHPFHDDERLAIVLADVVDGADVGMVQRGCGARFNAEALNGLSIARQILGDELQRDRTAKAGVVGAVDDAHAAGSKLMEHPIVRDCFADHTEGRRPDRLPQR